MLLACALQIELYVVPFGRQCIRGSIGGSPMPQADRPPRIAAKNNQRDTRVIVDSVSTLKAVGGPRLASHHRPGDHQAIASPHCANRVFARKRTKATGAQDKVRNPPTTRASWPRAGVLVVRDQTRWRRLSAGVSSRAALRVGCNETPSGLKTKPAPPRPIPVPSRRARRVRRVCTPDSGARGW